MIHATLRRGSSLALAAGGFALLLTGCTAATATTQSGVPSASASARPTGAPAMPGASGIIAEIAGRTLQVQGNGSQTAVTYTTKTTFTQQVSGTAGDITVGSCVRVASADAADATAVTATSVTVSTAVDGACTWGVGVDGSSRGGRPSGMPSGAPGGPGMPSGAPSGMPSGGPSGMPSGMGRMLVGTVTAADGKSVTVSATQPGSDQATTVTVTLGSAVTITTSQKASASALKVGLCASARGASDSTGAITATSISLSRAVDGACRQGR